MGFIDIVLIVIVGAFVFFGFFFGLVHTLGSLVGTIIGIFFASRLVDPTFETFGFLFGGGTFARILIFVIIFFLITRLVGLVFWIFEKAFGVFSWIPFAKSIDKLLGGFFGFIGDDVANDQRKVIYEQRNELLESADVSETITSLRQ
ncbi:MAG: CvpA family protein, partial [Candidatus Uhrbacteria bacterium]|nr:CvpA family protein [Candidatus Uhrbacteria bacterium]